MEWLHSRIDQRAAIAMGAIILILDLISGSYHISHGGPGSGRVELIFAPVFILMIAIALVGRSRQEQSPGWKVTRWSVMSIFFVMALFFVGLSIYHFAHQGPRSGGMEMALALLLIILGLSL
jgi:hypothetical protein